MRRNTDPTCEHCGNDFGLSFDVHCAAGQGLPHCQDHRGQCAICLDLFCTESLTEIETGEMVCEECKEIAITPLHVAAKKAARTGTQRDLKAYLKAKRDVA